MFTNTTAPATCLPHTGFAGVWAPAKDFGVLYLSVWRVCVCCGPHHLGLWDNVHPELLNMALITSGGVPIQRKATPAAGFVPNRGPLSPASQS